MVLDAWMFPLEEGVYGKVEQPVLFINSETFHWKNNIKKIVQIMGKGRYYFSFCKLKLPSTINRKQGKNILIEIPACQFSKLTKVCIFIETSLLFEQLVFHSFFSCMLIGKVSHFGDASVQR